MTPAQRRSAASKKASRSRKKLAEARSASKSVAVGAAHADRMPSKSDQIEALLRAGTLTRAEIAAKMGCKTAFVRAVYQRRIVGSNVDELYRRRREADAERYAAYLKRLKDRFHLRYHSDPEFRERRKNSVLRYKAKKRAEREHAHA